MDTSNLTVEQLNFIYLNGNYQLKALASAELSAIQMSQHFKQIAQSGA